MRLHRLRRDRLGMYRVVRLSRVLILVMVSDVVIQESPELVKPSVVLLRVSRRVG